LGFAIVSVEPDDMCFVRFATACAFRIMEAFSFSFWVKLMLVDCNCHMQLAVADLPYHTEVLVLLKLNSLCGSLFLM
jgi:hypothetical protein